MVGRRFTERLRPESEYIHAHAPAAEMMLEAAMHAADHRLAGDDLEASSGMAADRE